MAGCGLQHVWAVLALCNTLRLSEFLIALRRAENDVVDEPGAIASLLRRPHRAVIALRGTVSGLRQRVTQPTATASGLEVPDIAGQHPHLL